MTPFELRRRRTGDITSPLLADQLETAELAVKNARTILGAAKTLEDHHQAEELLHRAALRCARLRARARFETDRGRPPK